MPKQSENNQKIWSIVAKVFETIPRELVNYLTEEHLCDPYNMGIEQKIEPLKKKTVDEAKKALVACDELSELNKIKKSFPSTVLIQAYWSLSPEEESRIDQINATRISGAVYKYLGCSIQVGEQRLWERTLVYLDKEAWKSDDKALVWSINSLINAWTEPIKVNWSDLKLIRDKKPEKKAVDPPKYDQLNLIDYLEKQNPDKT